MTIANTEAKRQAGNTAVVRAAQPLSVRVRRRTAIVTRWLHIYLSMVSFAVVLFFAVTGWTLNHAEYLSSAPRVTQWKGDMPVAVLKAAEPDKLAIVEQLRKTHGIHGAVSEMRVDADQVSVSFRGPGYTADTFIDRATGKYDITETRNGVVAVVNDLHKGRDTGGAWSWVIDVSAWLLTLVSLSGLLLIFFVYKRRLSGLVLAAVGAGLCFWMYKAFVP